MPGSRPMPPRPPMGMPPRPGVRPVTPRRERPSAPATSAAPSAPPPITRTITLAEGMTVKDLADKLDVRVKDVLAKLLMKRMMMTINSTLDIEVAKDIAREFGAEIEMRSFEQEPGANPDNVKRELAELNLVPEDWGGTTVMVPVSAKKRQNLDQLLEMILLSTDILELKANPKHSASGTVLEAKLDRGRGAVATVLVQDGTLSVGDNFIAGPVVGRVRALIDDRGRPVKAAGPSTPVEVLGLTSLPQPGDPFQTVADAAKARQIANFRQTQAKERALGARGGRLTLESLKEQIAEGGVKELPIIVKADVQGSSEVLADSLTKLSDEKVKIRIIRAGAGAINESDVLLASASNAIIIGFNARPERNAADMAEREEVDIRLHSVIYTVTDEIKKGMEGLLEPTYKEVRIGTAEVR